MRAKLPSRYRLARCFAYQSFVQWTFPHIALHKLRISIVEDMAIYMIVVRKGVQSKGLYVKVAQTWA